MCILPLRTHRKIAPLFVAAAGVLVVAVVVVWPRSAHHIKRSYSFTICSLSICCAQTLLQTSKTRSPRHLPLVWSTYYGPTQKILLFSRENICSDFRFNSIRVVFCCRPRSPSYIRIYNILFYFIFFFRFGYLRVGAIRFFVQIVLAIATRFWHPAEWFLVLEMLRFEGGFWKMCHFQTYAFVPRFSLWTYLHLRNLFSYEWLIGFKKKTVEFANR